MWVSLVGRRRPILLPWTIYILMVYSPFPEGGIHTYLRSLALGILDEVELLGLKGSKKKKSKKLDEDFVVRGFSLRALRSLTHSVKCSPNLNLSLSKTYRRSYRQCAKRRAGRSFSSCLLASRLAYLTSSNGSSTHAFPSLRKIYLPCGNSCAYVLSVS